MATCPIVFQSCFYQTVQTEIIKIKGSDTMLPLTTKLAEEFMRMNKGVSIYVEGGGTERGIEALLDGQTDICTASRLLKPDEAKKLADYYQSVGLFFLIAKDALSVFVNPQNQVRNFTVEELRKIFLCEITNWKDLGGIDEPIRVVTRPPNSGTYSYFKEHILQNSDYCSNSIVRSTNQAVINEVLQNPYSIGYGGLIYGNEVIHAEINGVTPSKQNARNDTYPITRYLHFFTTRSPSGKVKEFIDWILTTEGQRIIQETGYVSLWEVEESTAN